MNASVKHSSASAEHATPPEIVELAREAMGSIDLDPCSTAEVNRVVVRAGRFYDLGNNGLAKRWKGNVLLNPPGGYMAPDGMPAPYVIGESGRAYQKKRAGDVHSPRAWWEKLGKEFASARVTAFVYVCFSIEQLCVLQDAEGLSPLFPGYVLCLPKKRLAFWSMQDGKLAAGNQPTHHNAIVCGGPAGVRRRFRRLFRGLGAVGRFV